MKPPGPEKALRMIGLRLTCSEWVTFCSPRDRTYGIGPHNSALKTRSLKLRVVEGLDQHRRAGQGAKAQLSRPSFPDSGTTWECAEGCKSLSWEPLGGLYPGQGLSICQASHGFLN